MSIGPRYGDDSPRSEWVTKGDVEAFVEKCVKDGADPLAAKGESGLNESVDDGSSPAIRLGDLAYQVIEHSAEHYGLGGLLPHQRYGSTRITPKARARSLNGKVVGTSAPLGSSGRFYP
jgi:hypothetical protein